MDNIWDITEATLAAQVVQESEEIEWDELYRMLYTSAPREVVLA